MAKVKKTKTKEIEKTFKSISEAIQAKEQELSNLRTETKTKTKIMMFEIASLQKELRAYKIECECKEFISIPPDSIQCTACGAIKRVVG